MEEIHDRLRAEFESHGISAAQAARDAGEADSQGLRDVLSGRKRLTADLLGALVTGVGVDGQYVLTGQRGSGLSAEEKLMLDYYREASAPVRKAAMAALLSAATPSTQAQGNYSQHSSGAGAVQIGRVSGKARVKTVKE